MNETPKKVRVIEYNGSIDSYNELVKNLWDKSLGYHLWFVDEQGDITPKFTGFICDTWSGIRYKPGDVYVVDVKDE